MKRIILFFVVVIFLFIFVYSYTSCVTHSRVDNSIELCNVIIESIQLGENKVDKSIDGYEKVDDLINELKNRDELPINLTKYFSEVINTNSFFEEVKKDKPDITEEEVNKIYNQVFGNNTFFVEEETVFIDNSGDKCIKLKDLRRLDSGDGVVKYFNGEYVIDKEYIPLSYIDIKTKKEIFNNFTYCFIDNVIFKFYNSFFVIELNYKKNEILSITNLFV